MPPWFYCLSMTARIESWSIPGSGGEPIIGDTHVPGREPRGILIIAHGFKGYKDYGMFPRIAHECAKAGLIAHRFNFSHAGMSNNLDTFERPDLFELDTWNKQVFDLVAVLHAIEDGTLPSPVSGGGRGVGGEGLRDSPLPLFLLGHSRGGATVLLALGRHASEDPATRSVALPKIAGAITLSAPAYTNPFSPEQAEQLLAQGWIESPSSRTGQRLRVGRAFLQEQLDAPESHNLLALARNIRCPVLLIHGELDPTVPASCAHELAQAIGSNAQVRIIPGGDHVFNTPNPFAAEPPPAPSEQLAQVIDAVLEFTVPSPMPGA
jgi:uncharacterized protein